MAHFEDYVDPNNAYAVGYEPFDGLSGDSLSEPLNRTTAAIAVNASPSEVKAALEAIGLVVEVIFIERPTIKLTELVCHLAVLTQIAKSP